MPEESGINDETKTVPCDDNQATTAYIENDFYEDVHDNSSTITSVTSKTRASSTSSKISVKRIQAQERLKMHSFKQVSSMSWQKKKLCNLNWSSSK